MIGFAVDDPATRLVRPGAQGFEGAIVPVADLNHGTTSLQGTTVSVATRLLDQMVFWARFLGNDPAPVIAYPDGAVAIAAQERTQVGNGWYMPACDATLSVSDAPGPYGVFGYFASLTLAFDKPLRDARVLAQDLAGDEPIDISSMVQVRGQSLHLPGKVIRRIGLHNATPGDISAPGLVLAIG
jgi:hypothetical protein